MKRVLSIVLTCCSLVLCLSGCTFLEDLFLEPSAPTQQNQPPVTEPVESGDINLYEDQYMCIIDGYKYYMHGLVGEIQLKENSKYALGYLTVNHDGDVVYSEYDDFNETKVRSGKTASLYLFNKNTGKACVMFKVYNSTEEGVSIDKCRIYKMVLYREHLGTNGAEFKGFVFTSALEDIQKIYGPYNDTTWTQNSSYYHYYWFQDEDFGVYQMDLYVHKTTGKILHVSFETEDRVDKDGNLPDKDYEDDNKPDDDGNGENQNKPGNLTIQGIVLDAGDVRVYYCGVKNNDGKPTATFYIENNSDKRFAFTISRVHVDGDVSMIAGKNVDSVAPESSQYIEFTFSGSDFLIEPIIGEHEELVFDVTLSFYGEDRTEEYVGYVIDLKDAN